MHEAAVNAHRRGWGRCARSLGSVAAVAFLASCASAPAYLSMESDELWAAGTLAYEEGDRDDAIQILERFVATSPGDDRVPEARIYVARAYAGREEYLTAAAEYRRFLQLHPSHGLAPDASMGICRAYASLAPNPQRDQAYTRQAEDACAETAFEFRGLSVAAEADSIRSAMVDRQAQADFQDAEFYRRISPNSAILYYRQVIARYPQTRWAPQALLGIYRSYRDLEWGPEAEEAAARLLSEYPDSDAAAELRQELEDEANQGSGPAGAG